MPMAVEILRDDERETGFVFVRRVMPAKTVAGPPAVWWDNKKLKRWKGCVSKTPMGKTLTNPRGYLRVTCKGGINQQRQQICDAVALASYLGTHLLVPELAKNAYWKDSASFEDVFDTQWFVATLKRDVKIIREHQIPTYATAREPFSAAFWFDKWRNSKVALSASALQFDPPPQSSIEWWDKTVKPLLWAGFIVHIHQLTDRLHYNHVPKMVQQVRCRACFSALRWSAKVSDTASKMVEQMQSYALALKSKGYIALHLRLEKDSLSHSGCRMDMSDTQEGHHEDKALAKLSKQLWKDHTGDGLSAIEHKAAGHCPLTAAEAARFLEGLGYPYETPIFVAGGKPEKGSGFGRLLRLYPNVFTKETLLDASELSHFSRHPSFLAGLDYLVCRNSTVFVATHGGNMADFLIGERTYHNLGLSLSPHKQFLMELFSTYGTKGRTNVSEVMDAVRQRHQDMRHVPVRPRGVGGDGKSVSVYRVPLPDCMCYDQKALWKGIPNEVLAAMG